MDQPSDEEVDAFVRQETLDNCPHCPSCGYPMPIMLTDMNKPFNEGRYAWNCHNETCSKMWESHFGNLVPRVPQDREI